MKFLADENLEASVVEALRRAGHDVATVPASAGIGDREVLALSVGEHRLLLTNDKDFAELAFLQRSASVGIVLIRLPRCGSAEKASRVADVVMAHGDRLEGALTVIEQDASRRRALPHK
jgi:predicted nuclease of predicted toxin-antitoxin system